MTEKIAHLALNNNHSLTPYVVTMALTNAEKQRRYRGKRDRDSMRMQNIL